ncbi:hypothetical protein [Gluconacetobacter tumulisoli]|uniref:Uncharacterized protein n=1 Tax=Gluconacetobacter tumulisoli TaxID=1286189 RepID=A0A7W4K761_9PROT|nr:hypothetical protein [Gluconacetobacter tumulisoli]MBB2201591.1 hypothetical protein [Gluconacetobacter tumulisoli]
MADFFTHFSCVLDVGTVENAAKALDLYNKFMDDLEAEDPRSDGFRLSVEPEYGGTKLWMRDETTGDPQQVVEFVLRCARAFRLTGRWGFQWANSCSRPRIGAFSGGAHVVDLGKRRTVSWVTTDRWLAQMTGQDKRHRAPRDADTP